MPLEKVWISTGCITCNSCEIICPDVFEVTRTTSTVKLRADLAENEELILEAAEACPVEVIHYQRSNPPG